MVVDLRFNKKGLNYAKHTVFERKIREMEEALVEAMNDIEGCLQECQKEEDLHSLKS